MARTAVRPAVDEKEPLSRERIELAALDLIEAEGLAAFSTRKLAAKLGYEAMSIYHYFPSKGHLMDALIDHVVGEMPPFPDPSLPWLERVRILGRDVRREFVKRPSLFVFVGTHRMNTPKALAWLDRSLALFEESGLPHELAVRVFRAVSYYLTGASLDETAGYSRGPSTVTPVPEEAMRRQFSHVVAAGQFFRPNEFDETFELGWELMLTGIATLVKGYKDKR
jgi:AcrR family transcriptional regulator